MQQRNRWSTSAAILCGVVVLTSAGHTDKRYRGWPSYGGGPEGMRYSALRQVTASNVGKLQVAWTYDSGGASRGSQIQTTPIVIGRVLYGVNPAGKVFAVDASSGRELWTFDPSQWAAGRGRIRGLMYWTDGRESRIYSSHQQWLFALDATTGKLITTFGVRGVVDLRQGFERPADTLTVGLSTPGVVYKDLLILGSIVSEDIPAAPGDIRAFDARTGKIRWTFHTIPRPGEFGYDTWPKDAWKHTGGANNWSGMALDEKRGVVYVPTGTASFDFYGGDRIGDNLFGNCLIALKAETGERLWHFQFVRHDLWDRDLPAAPSLVTVKQNGRIIEAVAQTTKSGHVFVFDRDTGKPVFPIRYDKVPPSDVDGEVAADTQPLPVKPPPFSRQTFTEEIATKRTPEAHQAVVARLRSLRSAGQWVPPSLQGTVFFPGLDGGDSWGGAAFDPETGLLYVNGNEMPWILQLGERRGAGGRRGQGRGPLTSQKLFLAQCAACHGADMSGSPPDLPSLVGIGSRKSPAEITAIIRKGVGRMPAFAGLTDEAVAALTQYLAAGEDRELVSASNAGPTSPLLKYRAAVNSKFLDPDGYPAVEPPWGTLNAIDLNKGEIAWQVPLGEVPELAAKGMKNTGTQNFGGPIVTAGGLVFIGATTYDEKFRAFDKKTGKLVWETRLPAGNFSTPAMYELDGRQFIVVPAGGGRGLDSSGKYVAFALPR